ncbi:MAG: hypothetical protein ABII12_02230 [Planctomycetota bacterium]
MDADIALGIDEAGYGPILGPLVVSAVAFETPPDIADRCLWGVLAKSVSRNRSARGGKVPILDSKKLYSRKEGIGRLERSVLAVMSAWRGSPPHLHGLLGLLCPDVLAKLREYPWYREVDAVLPREADAGGIQIAGSAFRRDLNTQNVHVAGMWSEILPEGHYNRLVANTQNKAVVLSGLTLRLIQRAADAHPGRSMRIYVDKQGARQRYGLLLMRAFEDRRLRVIEETPEMSAYELAGSRTTWRVRFTQSGESHHLPVALASLVSKYLRELLMACFNRYWSREAPGARPTAGYYKDGLRFLEEIEPHRLRLGIERDQLVRQR